MSSPRRRGGEGWFAGGCRAQSIHSQSDSQRPAVSPGIPGLPVISHRRASKATELATPSVESRRSRPERSTAIGTPRNSRGPVAGMAPSRSPPSSRADRRPHDCQELCRSNRFGSPSVAEDGFASQDRRGWARPNRREDDERTGGPRTGDGAGPTAPRSVRERDAKRETVRA